MGGVDMTITGMWHEMPLFGKGIAVSMMLMSIYSIAIFFEKLLLYRAAVKQSITYLPIVTKALRWDIIDGFDFREGAPKISSSVAQLFARTGCMSTSSATAIKKPKAEKPKKRKRR